MHNILDQNDLENLKREEPQRFKSSEDGSCHLDLRGLALKPIDDIDIPRIENLARIVRGLAFAAIDGIKSGHPGGSSSKVEQVLSLLFSGVMAFDPLEPKHPGRSRVVWSAGHCTPLFFATLTLIYESLRREGKVSLEDKDRLGATFGQCLTRFRRCDGPTGHVESRYALADISTGSSGHGFSAALGLATLQRSNGLETKVFVIAGDAETEEGMSYEARNMTHALGMDNIIISLDYNGFGIDGPVSDVIGSSYLNHWFGPGWNIIEVDGHNILELNYAYKKANNGFDNKKSTVVICHTTKGKYYGKFEGTADSHGSPVPHQEYVEIMKKLEFDIPGIESQVDKDIEVVLKQLKDEDVKYVLSWMEITKKNLFSETELLEKMKQALKDRPFNDYKLIERPETLPPELVFKEGESVATRKASEAFFKWLMSRTAFFYIGAGDLMKSVLTGAAENVYGVISEKNPLGRGIRFGIAEQNMAMMSCALTQDILPGGFQAMSVFSSYGVFTSMMSNAVRMALIGNAVNPKYKGFWVMIAGHDGPETGEDGPTHQGLFWMSLYNAYPGIKVYKPMDANETMEMLFYALSQGQPIALSVSRPGLPVLKRGSVTILEQTFEVPPAREAINGSYVYKPFQGNGKKKVVLVICAGQMLQNTLEILPQLIERGLDVKIVAVTSPELYEELCQSDPIKAKEILSDEERQYVITLHNGWPGFLHPFILPIDYPKRALGISKYLKSGPAAEVYEFAEMHPIGIMEKILKAI